METLPSTRDLLDSLVSAILVTDSDMCLCYMNQSAEELIGNSFSRIKHQSIHSIIFSPDLVSHIEQAVATQQSHVARARKLFVYGQHIHVDCSITPLIKHDNINGLLFEITKVDRQLRIARESRLIKTQATNQSVLRGIAHEIKNPLGGLRGAAQLLELELPDESLKEYTQIIISEADRLTKLVDNMLGANHPLQKEAVNIHQILEHSRQLIDVKYADSTNITTDYDPSIPEIRGDRDKLIQVVLNLLNNAVKSLTNNGHIIIKTRVLRNFTIRQINHPLVLCAQIVDNGQGIPEGLQDKIFYPMITGHADGTGLGLSISQTIINQHDGLIEFTSKPGETIFSMVIPVDLDNG